MLYNMGEVSYNRIGTYGFEVKRENEFVNVVVKTLKLIIFEVVVLTSTGEKCTKMRATRTARSLFPLLTNSITAFWPALRAQSSFCVVWNFNSEYSILLDAMTRKYAEKNPSAPNTSRIFRLQAQIL